MQQRKYSYSSQCKGKHPYDSYSDAKRGKSRGGMCIYKCVYCSKWHLGSQLCRREQNADFRRKRFNLQFE
jgi:hypothetical protein